MFRKIFLLLFFVFVFGEIKQAAAMQNISSNEKIAHVYVDLASNPALFQMLDALRQKPEDPKLCIWKRFKALPETDEVLTSMNAQMVDAKFLGETNYEAFSNLVDKEVEKFYSKYSDYHFIVHLNAGHIPRSGHIFDLIPKDQIKYVYLYEDSIGRSLWDYSAYNEVYHSFSDQFPTYFCLGYHNPQVWPMDQNKLIYCRFEESLYPLSADQKEKLSKLVGLDFHYVQEIFKEGRPVAVFLDDPNLASDVVEKFIQKLIEQNPDVQNYTWIYKNHPRVDWSDNLLLLGKYFSKIIIIPNSVPIESLILLGLSPDYVAGYGTSVFYSFKKEQILGYIRRKVLETYENYLLDLGILTPELVFDVHL